MKSANEMIDIQSDNSSGQQLFAFQPFLNANNFLPEKASLKMISMTGMRMSETDRRRSHAVVMFSWSLSYLMDGD
jgi:hypothetical protein